MNISADQTNTIDTIVDFAKHESQSLNLEMLADYIHELCEWDIAKAVREVREAAAWLIENDGRMTLDASTGGLIWSGRTVG